MSIVSLQSGSVPSTYSSRRYQPTQSIAPDVSVPVIEGKAEVDIVKFLATDSSLNLTPAADSYYNTVDNSTAINVGMNKHVCVNQDLFPSEKMVITSQFKQQSAGNQDVLSQQSNVGNISGVANIAKYITSTGSVPMYDSSYLVKIDAGSDLVPANLLDGQTNPYSDVFQVGLESNLNSAEIKNRFKALCNPKNMNNFGQQSAGETVIGAFIQESADNSNILLVNQTDTYINRNPNTNKLIGNQVGGSHQSAADNNYVINPIEGLPGLKTGSYKIVYDSVNADITVNNSAANQSVANNLPFGVHKAQSLTTETALDNTVVYSANIENLTNDYFSDAKTEVRYGFKMDVEVNGNVNGGYQGRNSNPSLNIANVIADSATDSDLFGVHSNGWSFHNSRLLSNNKMPKVNWYVYGNTNVNSTGPVYSDISSMYMIIDQKSTNVSAQNPFVVVYSRPQASGNAASWYRSKWFFGNNTGANIQGKMILYIGSNPVSVRPEITNRVELIFDASLSAGPRGSDEIISLVSVQTSSNQVGTQIGDYKFMFEDYFINYNSLPQYVFNATYSYNETDSSEVFTLDNSALVNNDKYMKAIWNNGDNDYDHQIEVNNGNVVLNPANNNLSVGTETEYLGSYGYDKNGLIQIENKATNDRVEVLFASVNYAEVTNTAQASGLVANVYYETTDPGYTSAVGILDNNHLTTQFINYDVTCECIKASELVVGTECLGKNGNSALIKREYNNTVNENVLNDTLDSTLFTFTENANVSNQLADNELQWVDVEFAMDMMQDGNVQGFVSSSGVKSSLASNYFESSSVLATNLDLNMMSNDLRLVFRNKVIGDLPALSDVNWLWDYNSSDQYLYSNKHTFGVVNVIDQSSLKSWMTDSTYILDESVRRTRSLNFNYALKVFNVSQTIGVKDQLDIFSYHVSLEVSSNLAGSNPVKINLDLNNASSQNGNDYTFSNLSVPLMIGNYNNIKIKLPTFTLRKVALSNGNINIVFVDGSSVSQNGPSSYVVFNYYDFFTAICKVQKSANGGANWSDVELMSGSEGLSILNDNVNFHLDLNYGIQSSIKIDDFATDAEMIVNLNINHAVTDVNNNYKQKEFVLDMKMRTTNESALVVSVSGKKYQTSSDILNVFDNNSIYQHDLPANGLLISNLNATLSATNDTVTIVVKKDANEWFTIVSTRNVFQNLRIVSQKYKAFKVIESFSDVPFGTSVPSTVNVFAAFGNNNNQINLNNGTQNIGTVVSGVLISYPVNFQIEDNFNFSLKNDEVKVDLYYSSLNVGVSNYSVKQYLSSSLGLVAHDGNNARKVTFSRWRNNNGTNNSSIGPISYNLVRTVSTVTFKVIPINSGSTYSYIITDSAPMYTLNFKDNIPAGTLGNLGLKLTYNCSMVSGVAGSRLYTLNVNPDSYAVTYSVVGRNPARFTLSNKFVNSVGDVISKYHMHNMPSQVSSPNQIVARRVYNGAANVKYTIQINSQGNVKIYRVDALEMPETHTYALADLEFDKTESELDDSFVMNGYIIGTNITNGVSTFRYINSTSYIQMYYPQIRLVYPDVRAITSLPYEVKYPGDVNANYKEWYLETNGNNDLALPDGANPPGSVVDSNAVNVIISHPSGKTLEQYLQFPDPSLRYPLRPATNKLTLQLYYGIVNSVDNSLLIDTLFNSLQLNESGSGESSRSKQISVTYNASTAVYDISYVQYNDENLNIFSNNQSLNPNASTKYNVFFRLDNPYLMPGSYWINHDVTEGMVFNVYGSRFVSDNTGLSFVIDKYTTATVVAAGLNNMIGQSGVNNYEDTLENIISNMVGTEDGPWNPTALNSSTPQRLSFSAVSKKTLKLNFNALVPVSNADFNAARTFASTPVVNFATSCNRLSAYLRNNESSSWLNWVSDNAFQSSTFEFSMSPLSNYGTQIIVQALAAVSPLQPLSVLTIYQPDLYKVVSEDKAPVFRIKHNGAMMAIKYSGRVIELAANNTNPGYENDYVTGNVVDF